MMMMMMFNFSGQFRAAQTLTFRLHVVAYTVKITLLVSCPLSHEILATPLSMHVHSCRIEIL